MEDKSFLENSFVEFNNRKDLNGYAAEAVFAAYAFSIDEDMRWLGGNREAVDVYFDNKKVDVKRSFIQTMLTKDGSKRDCVAFMSSSRRSSKGGEEARTDLVTHYGLVIPSLEGAFVEGADPDHGLEINIRIKSPQAILLVPSEDINKYFHPAYRQDGTCGKGANFGLDIQEAEKYLVWGDINF